MKTIIIDNQEYELTPINKYKAGDWVIFNNGGIKTVIRKIVSEEEYKSIKNNVHNILASKYVEWMSFNASTYFIKDIERKATKNEIKNHLADMARQKGLIKGTKVKRLGNLDDTTFVTIVQEDDDYYFEQDEYCKSGIILYSKGEWVTKIEEPKFSFGEHECTFKVVSSGEKYNFKTIEVNCKGETGTHHEIENILTHYFRPVPFGKVLVKKWTPKNIMYINTHLGIQTHGCNEDLKYIDTITIGCLTGTYKELNDIFNHCQKLLK